MALVDCSLRMVQELVHWGLLGGMLLGGIMAEQPVSLVLLVLSVCLSLPRKTTKGFLNSWFIPLQLIRRYNVKK